MNNPNGTNPKTEQGNHTEKEQGHNKDRKRTEDNSY